MANSVARWVGIGLGSIVGLAVLGVGAVYADSQRRATRHYAIDAETVTLPGDPASLERGRHLAIAIGKCVDCHGPDLGGKTMIDDPGIGHYVAPNLTAGTGGIGRAYSGTDWVRAIRHGVAADGHPLAFMPSDELSVLADEDLGDLIAYVKSVPAVDRQPGTSKLGPVGRLLLVTGKLPLFACETLDHQASHPATMPVAATAEYGKYIAAAGGCTGCHGQGLSGGQVPGTPPNDPQFPPAANLTPAGNLKHWTEANFVAALRTGRRPDGSTINPFMPWELAGQMTDTEMQAVWSYLQQVPARPTGQR